jgi:hypothetical protein
MPYGKLVATGAWVVAVSLSALAQVPGAAPVPAPAAGAAPVAAPPAAPAPITGAAPPPPAAASAPGAGPQPPAAGARQPSPPPGANRGLMTPEERAQHRQTMQTLPPGEREAYMQRQHEEMKKRAAAMGVTLPDLPGPYGGPGGPGMGPRGPGTGPGVPGMGPGGPALRPGGPGMGPGSPAMAPRGPGMGPAPGPGRSMVTDEERAKHREAMRGMSGEERAAYHARMRDQMRKQAEEQGMVAPPSPLPPRQPRAARPSPDEWRARMQEQAGAPALPMPEQPPVPAPGREPAGPGGYGPATGPTGPGAFGPAAAPPPRGAYGPSAASGPGRYGPGAGAMGPGGPQGAPRGPVPVPPFR